MQIYGYVRVSTADQNTERQLIKMRSLGIAEERIYIDRQSGKDFNRLRYQALRARLEAGDILYLDSLDRLGRDYDGIMHEWKHITRVIAADIVVLDNEELFDSRKFRTMGDIGKLLEDQLLSTLAYVAEQERKKNRQRQAEGIAAAKGRGVYKGRPKRYNEKHAGINHAIDLFLNRKQNGYTVKKICEITKIGRSSLYRELQEREPIGRR